MGLRGEVLVAGGYRGGFCEKLQEASTMSDKSGSMTDPLLAKVEPISDGGSASVITELRRGRRKILGSETAVRERNKTM